MLLVTVKHLLHTVKKQDFFSDNDLFVVVQYGKQSRRTTTKWNTKNPRWDETFLFPITVASSVKLSLYEQGLYKSNKVCEYTFPIVLDTVREYSKNIFYIEMGDVYCLKKEEKQLLRDEITQKTKKITSLIHTVNTMQEQIDALEHQSQEQQKHIANKDTIITSQRDNITTLNSKVTKIMNFLSNLKNET